MLSSLTTEGAAVTLDALELGAIDFAAKPSGSLSVDIGRIGDELIAKVRAAASVSDASLMRTAMAAQGRIRRESASAAGAAAASARMTTTAPAAGSRTAAGAAVPAIPATPAAILTRARRLVVIASSTGGPGTLSTLVAGLPNPLGAGVVVVQHMPAGFTASLAQRLGALGALKVSEAAANDMVAENRALVAAGGSHLVAASSGRVQLVGLPPVNGVRPAADVTLNAVAPLWRDNLLVVVLTGMGTDGREGARSAKAHGATVFAQDEATSIVYGMPAAVAHAGLADKVLPLPKIADAIARWARGGADALREAV